MTSLSRDSLSRSVAVVGDVNGDGFSDLAIGYPYSARCLLYFTGGEGLVDLYNPIVIYGTGSDGFGWAVETARDVNRDGYEDFLVSAPYASIVYLFFGKQTSSWQTLSVNSLAANDGVRILPASNVYSFGLAVSGLGDFNGDGFVDIAISGLLPNIRSVIYVVYGNSSLPSTVDLEQWSNSTGFQVLSPTYSFAGISISSAGDLNNDGLQDLAIGSIPYLKGKYATQKTYLIFGHDSRSSSVLDLEKHPTSDIMTIISGGGFLASGVGDVNGDGLDDLMITAHYDWQQQRNAYLLSFPDHVDRSPTLLPSSSPTSSPSTSPSAQPVTSVPTNIPTYFDPQRLTPSPTAPLPPSPTFPPNQQPSPQPIVPVATSLPTYRPTRSPVTRKPTAAPISPTRPPTISPTPVPTKAALTNRPTETNQPTVRPTRPPSFSPSSEPSSSPSTSQISSYEDLLKVIVNSTNTYHGQEGQNQIFYISSIIAGSVTIHGKSGRKVYVIFPKRSPQDPDSRIEIADFEASMDLLDLSYFSAFHSMDDLSYSSDPLTIVLASNQAVVLSSHETLDLTEDNFVFSSTVSSSSQTSSSFKLLYDSSVLAPLVFLACFVSILVMAHCLQWRNQKKQEKEEKEELERIEREFGNPATSSRGDPHRSSNNSRDNRSPLPLIEERPLEEVNTVEEDEENRLYRGSSPQETRESVNRSRQEAVIAPIRESVMWTSSDHSSNFEGSSHWSSADVSFQELSINGSLHLPIGESDSHSSDGDKSENISDQSDNDEDDDEDIDSELDEVRSDFSGFLSFASFDHSDHL